MTVRRAVLAALLLLWSPACPEQNVEPGLDAAVVDAADAGEPADAAAPGPDAGEPDAAVPTPDTGPNAPTPAFERWCDKPWTEGTTPATPFKLGGEYLGVLTGIDENTPWAAGTMETMKVIPEHPFWVRKIRVAFKGTGKANVRLMMTFGRSYPGPFPDMEDYSKDLMTNWIVNATDADPETWIERDVSDKGIYLEPTQHYMLVYEHLATQPYLALEEVPAAEYSRALLFLPKGADAYGVPGNYRMELSGEYFCAWDDAKRSFAYDPTTAFTPEQSARVAVTDLNGDGHDDVVLVGPKIYLGDGQGGFAAPTFDPFAEAPGASNAFFADVDNDGDEDAFAMYYVGRDNDGDGYYVGADPKDCDDSDGNVNPLAAEVAGNGKDDDCDGTVDDGTSTADQDQDGVTIAQGDCDDTRKDVFPGAPELLDGRDDDCDGSVDEDFHHRILLNDGTGRLHAVASAGVESIEPSTTGAFFDYDRDGKLDFYWGNWLVHYPDDPAVPDRFVKGVGDGTFVDRLKEAGMDLPTPFSPYGVSATDYDGDGWPDLYVGNYHLYPNQLWHNRADGTFVDVAEALGVAFDDIPGTEPYVGGHTYGSDWVDADNDGDVDAFIANLSHPRTQPWADPSMFVVNQGPPDFKFVNQRAEAGFIYDEGDINPAFADYDNDGDLDMVIASLYTGHYSRLYRNDGNLKFTDVTYEAGAAMHDAVSVTWADFDEDGDLDLIIASRDAHAPWVKLLKNQVGSRSSWVELDLQGTTSNRDAVGARVFLKACGTQMLRDVHAGQGSSLQLSHRVHFGLGSCATVDELKVRWPNGATETIAGASPQKLYRVVEGSGVAVPR